jgi:hypothetical protein
MEKNLAVRYAEAVDTIDAHRQTIAALNEKIAGLESVLADNELLQSKVTQLESDAINVAALHDAAMAEITGKLTAIETEKTAIAEELETVKGRLAMSPAHIDLGGRAALKDEAEGGETITTAQHWENYAKMQDPAAKAAYFKANRNEMEKK